MPTPSSRSVRNISLLVSAALIVLIGWGLWRESPPPAFIEVVDQSSEFEGVLIQRQVEAGGVPGGAEPKVWPRPLQREALDVQAAQLFYPGLRNNHVFDPFSYVRREANLNAEVPFPESEDGVWRLVTNSAGLREDQDILGYQPDVRILVTGDSHTEGVCANSNSFPNVLEAMLAREQSPATVEVLNAGMGSFNFYNYLGVLERFRHLKPDVFVVAVYGGNDFYKNLSLLRFFERMPPPQALTYDFKLAAASTKKAPGVIPQELGQVVYFIDNPQDVELAIDIACSITSEIKRLSAEVGAELVVVYLPPPLAGQPNFYGEGMNPVLVDLGLKGQPVSVSDEIADRWLEFLKRNEIEHLDLRPHFGAEEQPLYWYTDHHLNVAGQRKIAELLKPIVESLL